MFYAGFQKGPVEFRTCPLDVDTLEGVSCPTYPTLAARGQDKRTPTYPTHKPDPLTTYPLPGKEPEPCQRFAALCSPPPDSTTDEDSG